MRGINHFLWTGVLVASTAFLNIKSGAQSLTNTIKTDGSSTVFPVTKALAKDFQRESGVLVTVNISGTGGGFRKFCNGEIDMVNASRPILPEELQSCQNKGIQFYELPIAYDALTIVVHPQNTWMQSITLEELKKLWEPAAHGKINTWNQVNAKYPNSPIRLFGPGSDSGTFDYFTEAIVGKAKSSRTDYVASEDDEVLVKGVAKDKNALGYFGYAYFAAHRRELKAVPLNNVMPSEITVMNGKYTPLSRPLFVYVNRDAAKRREVKQFVNFYMQNAARTAKQVGYIPLSGTAYLQGLYLFQKERVGSAFLGKKTTEGLTIEQLFQR